MSGQPTANRDDVLAQLSKLQAQDRAWLIGRLSGAQRAALMDLARTESSPSAASVASANHPEQRTSAQDSDTRQTLQRAHPEAIVALLCDEPAWLVHAFLSLEEWRWKAEVWQGLPPALRAGISQMPACQLPLAVKNALLQQCVEQLPQPESVRARSTAQALAARVGRFLVERRLALRA